MSDAENKPEPPLRPHFGLAKLMLVMVVFSVMGAGVYHLARANQAGINFSPVFVIFITAAPLLLVVVISILYRLLARFF